MNYHLKVLSLKIYSRQSIIIYAGGHAINALMQLIS